MSIHAKFCGCRGVVRGGLGVGCAGTGTFGMLSSTACKGTLRHENNARSLNRLHSSLWGAAGLPDLRCERGFSGLCGGTGCKAGRVAARRR